jgi:molybdopterin-binding protein
LAAQFGLGIKPGGVCVGYVRAFWFSLIFHLFCYIQKEFFMSIQAINVRNQFRGKVREIIRGDVVSEIDVETPWGIVTSVITTRSVDTLDLKVGADVVALVKSTEVSLAKL